LKVFKKELFVSQSLACSFVEKHSITQRCPESKIVLSLFHLEILNEIFQTICSLHCKDYQNDTITSSAEFLELALPRPNIKQLLNE
jgi:hypothetical protein